MCPLLGIWFSIKLAKTANLEFYCSLKMGWQLRIWPPTMKYLPLTSHFSDYFSGRGLASAAITTASLSTTQKHFDWAVQVLLAYKKHLQVDYSKAAFVPNALH